MNNKAFRIVFFISVLFTLYFSPFYRLGAELVQKIRVGQIKSGSAPIHQVIASDGAGNCTFETVTGNISPDTASADIVYTDKVISKTVNGAVTVTSRVSASNSISIGDTLFTDEISSKTVNTPIAVTQNISGTSASFNGHVFMNSLQNATDGTTITVRANGAGVDFGNSRVLIRNGPTGGDADGDILVRATQGSVSFYKPLAKGAAGTTLTVSGTVGSVGGLRWNQPVMSSVSGGYVTRSGNNLLFKPDKSNRVYCFENSTWIERQIPAAGITVSCVSLTADTDYFLYVFDSSGTLTLELSTTSTVLQDGIPVKSGDTDHTLIARCRSTGTASLSAQILTVNEDAKSQLLCNTYNKRRVSLIVTEATDSWTTATTTFNSANSLATNRVTATFDGTNGVDVMTVGHGGGLSAIGTFGIGLDSTTVNSAQLRNSCSVGSGVSVGFTSSYTATPSAGSHFFQWLQVASGATATFFGDNGATNQMQSGMRLNGDF